MDRKITFIFAKGSVTSSGKSIEDAIHNIKKFPKNTQIGPLILIRDKGLTYWYSSKQFLKKLESTKLIYPF